MEIEKRSDDANYSDITKSSRAGPQAECYGFSLSFAHTNDSRPVNRSD